MPSIHPPCPNCLNEMSKTPASRNMFNCEPCREIIQFFDGRVNRDHARRPQPLRAASRPILNIRAA